jgi:hypothetical protein
LQECFDKQLGRYGPRILAGPFKWVDLNRKWSCRPVGWYLQSFELMKVTSGNADDRGDSFPIHWALAAICLAISERRVRIRDWPPAVALIAMIKTLVAEERVQSRREEIANSVSSGVGLIAIIGGIPFLLGSAIQHGSEFSLAGAIIFAATMVSL